MQCTFEHPDGRQCGAPALKGKILCLFHDPSRECKDMHAVGARRIAMSRREMINRISESIRNLDFEVLDAAEKAKLLAPLMATLAKLLDSRDDIAGLKKLAEKYAHKK